LTIAADDGAFEKTPDAFNTVSMNVATHPFLSLVIDLRVLSVAKSTPVNIEAESV
jgi:hypothetical protein